MSAGPRSEPERIVSLVPSDTYTLARLGVAERLVGRTEYCVAPAELVADVEVIGGTKNVEVERVVALAPDLVVANQEENRKKDIEALERAGLEVLLSFPKTVAEGLEHVEALAARFPSLAHHHEPIVERARQQLLARSRDAARAMATFVPIWMDPLMTVHADTFISDALELCGGRNVFSDRQRRYPLAADLGRRAPLPPQRTVGRDLRYPRVTLQEVEERKPELILLPDEPHAFSQQDAAVFCALDIPAAPEAVLFCDGKDLMWYGLRSLEGLERLAATIDAVRAAAEGS